MTIPEQCLPQILIALEHYAAYMHATNRDPRPYRAIAEQLVLAQQGPKHRPKSKPAQPTPKMASPQPSPPFDDYFILRIRLDLPEQ